MLLLWDYKIILIYKKKKSKPPPVFTSPRTRAHQRPFLFFMFITTRILIPRPPRFRSFRGNSTAYYGDSILHNKRWGKWRCGEKEGEVVGSQVCRRNSPFVRVRASTRTRVYAYACPRCVYISYKAQGYGWRRDSECAIMETMCSLRRSTNDKLFIKFKT